MSTYVHRSEFPVPVEALFAYHARPGAFERLAPPWDTLRVRRRSGGIRDGGRLVFQIKAGPLWITWEAHHRDYRENEQFVDEQIRGPSRRWVHTHRFQPAGPGASILEDHIEYEPRLGALGAALLGRKIRRMLKRLFSYRHRRTRDDLMRHAAFADRPRMRVAISGSRGLIGGALSDFLTVGGHAVLPLVRRAPASADQIQWDPARGIVDPAALDGIDAVVHLAGESVAGGWWTARRKAAIRDSRVGPTRVLCEQLARRPRPPRTLIAASAIGYYGDRGDEWVAEDSPPGQGFLAEVAREWEAATRPAAEAGIRVVNLRVGVVLSPRGGALAAMLPAFRMGVAGRLGSGRQYMSWIALDDLVGLIHAALLDERYAGPLNAVAPYPVTNAEFTQTLGRVLRRPTILPAPAFALRAALGQMAEEMLLGGVRARPAAAERAGFGFLYPTLEPALRAELGR